MENRMILDAFVQAAQSMTNPAVALSIVAGCLVGLMVGIIPGIGNMLAIALLMPFLFRVPPEVGLPFLISMGGSVVTGGSITAILLNIPGEQANAATMLDGFPMTKKGQSGRALGASMMASGMGGVTSVLLSLAMVPIIVRMIMGIRTSDMVFIILMGLCFIGVLGGRSIVKGAIGGLLGLLISFIGFQVESGIPRFTFGSLYLYDGLPLVPVTLGLFAIPEMVSFGAGGGTLAKTDVSVKSARDVAEGIIDVFRHWLLWLRSTIVGFIIGIVPGIGVSTGMFVAYGQAKQTSKHPEKFGTGTVEGVIAPQSAISACQAGDLLTTLAMGVPGSAGMALILSAIIMLGLTPGPSMMKENLPLSFLLFFCIIISHVMASGICLAVAPRMAKVAHIPSRILVPLVTALIFIGALTYRGYFNDVLVTVAFGIVGMAMAKFGYPRPAMLLGFVMGYLFERYFFMALGVGGPFFFLRPLSLTIILIIVFMFFLRPIRTLIARVGKKGARAAS